MGRQEYQRKRASWRGNGSGINHFMFTYKDPPEDSFEFYFTAKLQCQREAVRTAEVKVS